MKIRDELFSAFDGGTNVANDFKTKYAIILEVYKDTAMLRYPLISRLNALRLKATYLYPVRAKISKNGTETDKKLALNLMITASSTCKMRHRQTELIIRSGENLVAPPIPRDKPYNKT